MIERHHLAILHEVARQGTLTRAADALHLTQSALSHAVRKLEQHIGTALWEKQGRGLRLTQAGRSLLDFAQRVLPQFEQIEDQLTQFASGQRGALRIGMECHPCYRWLLKVVSPFLEQWPDVEVDVRQRFQFGGLDALLDHEIDLLITPDPRRSAGLTYLPVFDYEQQLVVSNRHRLAARDFIEPQDLMSETLFTYPVPLERLDIYTEVLRPAGIEPGRHKTIETTDIMLQTIAAGRGVGALPDWLVRESMADWAIVGRRLGRRGVMKQIFIGLRRADSAVDYVQGFLSLAQASRR